MEDPGAAPRMGAGPMLARGARSNNQSRVDSLLSSRPALSGHNEVMSDVGARVGWNIEKQVYEMVDEHLWVVRVPTGLGWGSCACGHLINDDNGAPALLGDVAQRLRDHITGEHPDWLAGSGFPLPNMRPPTA